MLVEMVSMNWSFTMTLPAPRKRRSEHFKGASIDRPASGLHFYTAWAESGSSSRLV
jgi:hypothetical protein